MRENQFYRTATRSDLTRTVGRFDPNFVAAVLLSALAATNSWDDMGTPESGPVP